MAEIVSQSSSSSSLKENDLTVNLGNLKNEQVACLGASKLGNSSSRAEIVYEDESQISQQDDEDKM